MPLLAFFKSDPATVGQLTIEQVVSNAGDGVLKDNSTCSSELREYLSQVLSDKIARYINHCLSAPFGKGGMVLQDLVNEFGRRLDYQVTNGRYQGTTNAIGLSPEGHSIIVEVKTTDAYRISLDTIARYRDKLSEIGQIPANSSILIVVGREDTGELEAQVRGSQHAWDIRLISADALSKLVQLKENTEGTESETATKIRSLLIPKEYTRLDQMIDVMFTTAKDVEGTVAEDIDEPPDVAEVKVKGTWQFTDSRLLQAKRDQIVAAFGQRTGATFIKRSRALLWDASHKTRLVCTISKRYIKKGASPYWFAYHTQWHSFLTEGKAAHLALGCMDLSFAFAIPVNIMSSVVGGLNQTLKDDGEIDYWHIHIAEHEPSQYTILLPKRSDVLPLDEYRVPIGI
jgi:hypothetical protein